MRPERPDLAPQLAAQLSDIFGEEDSSAFLAATWRKLVPESEPSFEEKLQDAAANGQSLMVPEKLDDILSRMQITAMAAHHVPSYYYDENGFTDVVRYLVEGGHNFLHHKKNMIDYSDCPQGYAQLDMEVRDGWEPVIEDIALAKPKDVEDLTDIFRDKNSTITFSLFRNGNKKACEQAAPKKPDPQAYLAYWWRFHNDMFLLCDAAISLIRDRAAELVTMEKDLPVILTEVSQSSQRFAENILPIMARQTLRLPESQKSGFISFGHRAQPQLNLGAQ